MNMMNAAVHQCIVCISDMLDITDPRQVISAGRGKEAPHFHRHVSIICHRCKIRRKLFEQPERVFKIISLEARNRKAGAILQLLKKKRVFLPDLRKQVPEHRKLLPLKPEVLSLGPAEAVDTFDREMRILRPVIDQIQQIFSAHSKLRTDIDAKQNRKCFLLFFRLRMHQFELMDGLRRIDTGAVPDGFADVFRQLAHTGIQNRISRHSPLLADRKLPWAAHLKPVHTRQYRRNKERIRLDRVAQMNPVSEDFPDSPGPGGHRLCIEDIGRRPEFYRKFFDFLFIHLYPVPRLLQHPREKRPNGPSPGPSLRQPFHAGNRERPGKDPLLMGSGIRRQPQGEQGRHLR